MWELSGSIVWSNSDRPSTGVNPMERRTCQPHTTMIFRLPWNKNEDLPPRGSPPWSTDTKLRPALPVEHRRNRRPAPTGFTPVEH